LVIAPTKGGVANTLKWYTSPNSVIADHVDGPGVDMACALLEDAGGPVGLLCGATSIAADNSAITKVASHTGPTITVAGTSRYDHFVELQIGTAGDLGAGTFRYSLDGWSGATDDQRTWTDWITIPSGGTYGLPNTDLTLTFPAGTYVAGSAYTFTAECVAMNSTDLAAAFDVLAATGRKYAFIVLPTTANTGAAAAHATLGAAAQAELNTLANIGKNRRLVMATDVVADAAAVRTALTSVVANRVLFAFGRASRLARKRFPGYARPRTNATALFASRAASVKTSTDLKRVLSGPLPGVFELFDDEAINPTGLDDLGISTMRSWSSISDGGVFIAQARLKAAAGSDYRYWQRGTVMDRICDIVFEEQVKMIGRGYRLNLKGSAKGALDVRDIIRLEKDVNKRLEDEVLLPTNEEGTQGHVTAVRYRINREWNVATTETIIGDVVAVPLVQPSYVVTTLGYSLSL
jgi:hypothetical protein